MPGRVAVVGGGISGLCAARLKQLCVSDVTVFDTGRHASGGRCSSRTETINGQEYIFDHSAQYFTVSDPRFAKIVSSLHAQGAVRVWSGPVGHLKRGGHFEVDSSLTQAFVGVRGMCCPKCAPFTGLAGWAVWGLILPPGNGRWINTASSITWSSPTTENVPTDS
ncbi:hypothetical protein ACOMHN_007604 [Nucella lapillus]